MNIKSITAFLGKTFAGKTIKPNNQNTENLFCANFWQEADKCGKLSPINVSKVSLHGQLNGINHFLITGANPKLMDEVFMNTNLTPRRMISLTDFEFKRIKPTTENLNVFRCIGEKPEFFSEYNLYKKRLSIKKGEIIDMKEYAYATSDLSYARNYLVNNKGIMYEIEVPENSRISRIGFGISDEVVFPRSSKFKCTEVKQIKNAEDDYTLIKLKYLNV